MDGSLFVLLFAACYCRVIVDNFNKRVELSLAEIE